MSNELGEFLRTRRARITPEQVGLPKGDRRRVPGLRRDELARLAGVSVEYYTRLEQGRGPNVSDSVLDAIARALSLDETEIQHLRTLVRPTRRARPSPRGAKIRDSVRTLLDLMDRVPAFVTGPRMDVVAWNRLGDAVGGFATMTERNLLKQVFLDPRAREVYPAWDSVAGNNVAVLRWLAGRNPADPGLTALVGELSMRSQEFRELWARHDVKEKCFGRKLLNHPLVGELELDYESLPLGGEQDMMLVMYVPQPGSAAAEKLALLASWSLPEPEDALAGVREAQVPAHGVEERGHQVEERVADRLEADQHREQH
jgi:transcriptional regulator with XRE-family HTH domain